MYTFYDFLHSIQHIHNFNLLFCPKQSPLFRMWYNPNQCYCCKKESSLDWTLMHPHNAPQLLEVIDSISTLAHSKNKNKEEKKAPNTHTHTTTSSKTLFSQNLRKNLEINGMYRLWREQVKSYYSDSELELDFKCSKLPKYAHKNQGAATIVVHDWARIICENAVNEKLKK